MVSVCNARNNAESKSHQSSRFMATRRLSDDVYGFSQGRAARSHACELATRHSLTMPGTTSALYIIHVIYVSLNTYIHNI